MAAIDLFNNNLFGATSLTAAVDKLGFVPGFLTGTPGLLMPVPVRTTAIFIEERENAPALIQTDSRGDAPNRKMGDKRSARGFQTLRLSRSSRVTADSLQNIRAFGSETELQQVQVEVARRQILLRRDFALTAENMALGLIQGVAIDADGSIIYNWATEFGQTIPAEINFDLANAAPASGAVRKLCNAVVRSILKALRGLGGTGVGVAAICGDAFWDDLTANKEVRETYLNTVSAADLRKGNAYESFTYGGITWTNYRGTDDGTTVAINTDKVRFFPVNSGIFQMAYAPAETFDFVNTLGQELYSWIELDTAQNKKWADVEMYSYPLPVCTMPQALHRGRRT